MKFSYNWLQSFFYPVKSAKGGAKQFNRVNKKLPRPEKLAEVLSMHFAEVEEIKRKGDDFVLNIDIRPNRAADCFSHMGIAREISAITGLQYQEQPSNFREVKSRKAGDFISVKVQDKKTCFRYSAKVITDVRVGPSPKWMQDRLKVCGLRPINNIVDIVNYVMLETGQPLHAFDFEKIGERKIIVRPAKKGEKIITLDEERYDLDKNILIIADREKPIGIAGIKGEKFSGIDEKTKIVVLEAANFNTQVIRKGSRKLNLRTDASLRFEHGLDPNLTETAIARTCHLLEKITKGKAISGLADFYPEKVLAKRIKLNLDYLERLLGIKIPQKKIIKILELLDFKIIQYPCLAGRQVKSNYLMVGAPTRRLDVSIEEDLIEEIGRVYGYEKIAATFPVSILAPPKRNLNIFWEEMVKNILKETGFIETYNYSFFSEKEARFFGCKKEELIELENPSSEEQRYLRASLVPNLLKNIEKNFRQFSEIKIFELGKIFKKPQQEKRTLTGVMTGDVFFEAKGVVDLLLNKLGISNVWFVESSAHLAPRLAKRGSAFDEYQTGPEESKLLIWHPQKCAEIKVEGKKIGFLGEISSLTQASKGGEGSRRGKASSPMINNFDFKGKAVLFDLDFEKLSQFASAEHQYRPISKFPSAVRDIAVLVPKKVRVSQVSSKIYSAGGKMIRDIDLFDIYQGEEIAAKKKNLAFHIIYRAEDRTLTSKEIDKIQQKIIKSLEKNPEWQVRK